MGVCATLVFAQTAEQKQKYPQFDEALAKWGYDWEPHKVKTDDGWILTIFRVTGRNGETFLDESKAPIFY